MVPGNRAEGPASDFQDRAILSGESSIWRPTWFRATEVMRQLPVTVRVTIPLFEESIMIGSPSSG
jgi:hypothetical protein